MRKKKRDYSSVIEPKVVEGVLDKDGVLVADGVYYRDCNGELKRETVHDISLRNYFAGCAITGIMANLLTEADEPDISFSTCSEVAYGIADAMVKEGDKRNE